MLFSFFFLDFILSSLSFFVSFFLCFFVSLFLSFFLSKKRLVSGGFDAVFMYFYNIII